MKQNGTQSRDIPLAPSQIHRRSSTRRPAAQPRSMSSHSSPATDYSWEITQNLLKAELATLPQPNYLANKKEITAQTRAILCDFVISLHEKLHLSSETLYVGMSLFDRVLSAEEIPRSKVQLLGVAALMVAGKYEEVTIPALSEYLEALDGAYTKADLLDMERKILQAVGFSVSSPTVYTFFRRIESLVVEDQVTMALGQYLLELSVPEYQALQHRPSLLTSACFYLSKRLRSRPAPWPVILQRQFGYSEEDLKPCLRLLYVAYATAERSVLQATRKKYAGTTYHEVSKLRL